MKERTMTDLTVKFAGCGFYSVALLVIIELAQYL
jgi:hypothetical protein